MNNDTLNHIEETLAHQERQIEDLSDMVNKQWQEIEALKRRLEQAQSKISDLEDGQGKSVSVSELAAQEKPPHY